MLTLEGYRLDRPCRVDVNAAAVRTRASFDSASGKSTLYRDNRVSRLLPRIPNCYVQSSPGAKRARVGGWEAWQAVGLPVEAKMMPAI
jgi:hypothetical protein